MLRDTRRLAQRAAALHADRFAAAGATRLAADSSLADADEFMRLMLLREARGEFASPLAAPPAQPHMHAVDLETEAPGIALQWQSGLAVARAASADDPVVDAATDASRAATDAERDEVIAEAVGDVAPPLSEASQRRREARVARRAREGLAVASATRRLERSAKAQEARIAKRERLANETADERQARLREQRETRAARAAQRATEVGEEDERDEEDDQNDDGGQDDRERDDQQEDGGSGGGSGSGIEPPKPPKRRRAVACEETLAERAADAVLPVAPARARVAPGDSIRTWFANPVPCVRALDALASAKPRESIARAIIAGVATPDVQVLHGPPGTGKSTALVRELADTLAREPSWRALVCAATNVAVARLYRLLATDRATCGCVALCLPPARVPAGTEVASADGGRQIVCATVSGRAGRTLHGERFDVVLLDEAGQCAVPHLWTLLRPEVRRLVVAGDPRQLPPHSSRASPCGDAAAGDAGWQSVGARLVDELGYPCRFLAEQHRMHPAIAEFPSRAFYGGRLRTAADAAARAPLADGVPPYRCRVAAGGAERRDGTSVRNDAEAAACAAIVRDLLARGVAARDVVLLTGYAAQCRALLALELGVAVHTVDSFQGQEAEAVVLSTVRDDECGFWRDARRLCVALTRAKRHLSVVGSFQWRDGPLAALAADAAARELLDAP
jgi:hypothetical protein